MRLKSRPREPSPSLPRVGSNFYSAVKQQDYSASVWLRRKDKLEHVSHFFFLAKALDRNPLIHHFIHPLNSPAGQVKNRLVLQMGSLGEARTQRILS